MSVDSDETQSGVVPPPPGKLPKGVVLGPDGKPCRTCSSKSAFSAMVAQSKSTQPSTSTPGGFAARNASTATSAPTDCPADVEELGRSTWTLLHSIAATYPSNPSFTHQATTRSFFAAFSQLYPCWHCATDFRDWMSKSGNEPRVSSRNELGMWLCEAHNAVNVKLGKRAFDCNRWEERWRTGWKDGSCD